MRYIFKDFEFDSSGLVLSKNSEAVAIRHNEAKVLALLLADTDKVLSKEEILSRVWQDKVVSEQAVFQNISHLRNLFGNEAIKTFPKRGYQWQLAVKTFTAQQPITPVQSVTDTKPLTANQPRPFWHYAVLTTFVVILLAVIATSIKPPGSTAAAVKIAYIPFSSPQGNDIRLTDSADFDFSVLTQPSRSDFLTSAILEYSSLATKHPFVLTAKIRTFKRQYHLDFLLKGPLGDWQGQISATSPADVIAQLQQHLRQSFIYDLLNTPQSPELQLAKLSIAHQASPDDLIVLGKLIDIYLNIGEQDKAMPLTDKLLTLAQHQNNPQQTGNALLFQSKILTRKELFDLSSHKLTLALAQFEKINDLRRQADVWFAQSWLDHQHDDYPALKTSLLKSAQLALDAEDTLQELNALTYLSVMAHKHHENDDKYRYLQQAEKKMAAYQLPIYHFAKVPFHYAIFTKETENKVPHLKQVLEFTVLTPDHWVAQSSRRQLVQYYIKQNRLSEAQTLVDNATSDNSDNSYLKTLIAQAKQQTALFVRHAQRTFEQAQLSGNKHLSLDLALLLCSAENTPIDYDFYSQYIHENATSYWRRNNKTKLLALNL